MEIREKISAILSAVKVKSPLIHHITNYVTVNDCANIVLAIGGSPVMADDMEEADVRVVKAVNSSNNVPKQRVIRHYLHPNYFWKNEQNHYIISQRLKVSY